MDLPALLLLWVHLSLMGQLFLVAHLCRMALQVPLLLWGLMSPMDPLFLVGRRFLMALQDLEPLLAHSFRMVP